MTETMQDHLGSDQLNALIDGELSVDEQRAMQHHLNACHTCALRVLSAMQLKAATARSSQRFVAPPEAISRLAAQLRPLKTKKVVPISSLRTFSWVAVAAGLVLTVSILGWRQIHPVGDPTAELLDQHLVTLSSAAMPEVLSTDRHTVKPWFQGKLPFSFNLPDRLPEDMTLRGADLAFLNGQPAALLLFTIHKHEVSVFLTQRSGNAQARWPYGTRSGFTIHSVATDALRITAISDVNPQDLDVLVSALVEAQASR